MARESESKLKGRVRALPWALVVRGGMIVGKRWTALSSKERARLAQLVRESRGRARNLSKRQQLELRRLARKLDLKGMSRELRPLVRGGKRSRKRR